MGALVGGRLSVAAGCLGVIEDCLAEVVRYAKRGTSTASRSRGTSSCRSTSRRSRWTD